MATISMKTIYESVASDALLEAFDQARDSHGRFASDDESDDDPEDPEDVVGLKELAQESRSKIARLKSKLASEHDRSEKARLKSQLEIETENLEDLENQISFAKNYRG